MKKKKEAEDFENSDLMNILMQKCGGKGHLFKLTGKEKNKKLKIKCACGKTSKTVGELKK